MSLQKVLAGSRALLRRNAALTRISGEQSVRNNNVQCTPPTEKVSFVVNKKKKRQNNLSKVKLEDSQPEKIKKIKKPSVKLKKKLTEENNCENIIRDVKVNDVDKLNPARIKELTELSAAAKKVRKKKVEEKKKETQETVKRNNKTVTVKSTFENQKIESELISKSGTQKMKKVKVVKKKRKTYKSFRYDFWKNEKRPIKAKNLSVNREEFSLSKNKILKLCFWNVAGLRKKTKTFWKFVQSMDVVGLTETWINKRKWTACKKRLPEEYDWECNFALKSRRKGRPRGGILCGVRNEIAVGKRNYLSSEVLETDIVLGETSMKIVTIYNSPSSSCAEFENLWETLSNEITPSDFLIIGGDFNARTGNRGGMECNGLEQQRKSKDTFVNQEGIKLLELCKRKRWIILNGNLEVGEGECTFVREGKKTVIDYVIASEKVLPYVKKFSIESRSESDHMPLKLELDLKKLMKVKLKKCSEKQIEGEETQQVTQHIDNS